MNEDMLAELLQQYKDLADSGGDYPVRTVSTDGKHGAKNSSFAIVSDLLDCFSEKVGDAT